MKTSKYFRKATRQFECAKCGKPICTGTKYIDFETVDHGLNDTLLIKHVRMHKECDHARVKYGVSDLPMPVQVCNVKYHLIGKFVFNDKWYLLVKDWSIDRYYKYRVVYDHNGNPIRPEDIEL